MAGDFQRITLLGNATKDAEAKKAKSTDRRYAAFRLGVKDTYFPVVVFGKPHESVAEYVKKGRRLLVEGRVDINQNGRANVIADKVIFQDAPPEEKPAGKKAARKKAEELRSKKKK
jgi:single-stranded DNA-binding protein